MLIRTARLGDCPAISRLHVDIWKEVYPYIPQSVHAMRNVEFRKQQWIKAITGERSALDPVNVLIDHNVLRGFSQVKENTDPDVPCADHELHACYLQPGLRGTTAGPDMMKHMLNDVTALGGTSCVIWVWCKNPMRITYRGLGFKIAHRRNRVIGGVDLPEVGVVHDCLPDLQDRLSNMIKRIGPAFPSENQQRRPCRLNPICERIGKSQSPIPQPIPVSHSAQSHGTEP